MKVKTQEVKPSITNLILDVDSTLFPWVDCWYKAYTSFVTAANKIMPGADFPSYIRAIYQTHGTSEYDSYLLAKELKFGESYAQSLAKAYTDAYNAVLSLYPTVLETLQVIKSAGTHISLYTESQPIYAVPRIITLGLDGIADTLLLVAPHDETMLPLVWPTKTACHILPVGVRKPSTFGLNFLTRTIAKTDAEHTACIGDSLHRDTRMHQAFTGCHDVFARYGAEQNTPAYLELERVTHWSGEKKSDERVKCGEVKPQYSIDEFSEILDLFQFSGK